MTQHQMLAGETKTAAIRRLWLSTELQVGEIAELVGCSKNRAYVVIWRMDHPNYNADYMRKLRKNDPVYYQRELAQQRKKYRSTPEPIE